MYSCTSEGQGQPLVEVFGVRFLHDGEAAAGTISVFDGKRGQILYSGSPVDKPSSRTQRSGGLQLTGPYRAVSADGCVAIVLDLHQYGRHDTASSSPTTSYVDEIVLDVYDEATRYDEPITSVVSSTSGDGGVEVTYALLSDAAEAIVEVRLLGQRAGCTVRGTIVARTDLGKVVLFDEHDGGAPVRAGTEEEPAGTVPLARSVVAVPLSSFLTVVVELGVDGDDGREEVVNDSVVCAPKLGGEDVQCCRPTAGVAAVEVEVKVTWLD